MKWEVRESRMLAESLELKRPANIAETRLEIPQGMREGVPVASDAFSARHSNGPYAKVREAVQVPLYYYVTAIHALHTSIVIF